MIGETPLLEFKEENTLPARELTAEETKDLNKYNKDARAKANDVLEQALDGADFAQLANQNSEDEYSKNSGGELGFISADDQTYSSLYAEIDKLNITEQQNIKKLIEDDDGLNIVKVNQLQQGEKQVKANHLLICFIGKQSCESQETREEALAKINSLKEQATADNFVSLVKSNSTEPGASDGGGDLGWFGRGVMVPEFENAVFDQPVDTISDVIETDFGFHLVYKSDEKNSTDYDVSRIFINLKTETDILPPQDQWINTTLSGKNLKRAWVEFDQTTNAPHVSLEFDDEGKQLFAEITKKNVGKLVAIFLDGQPISIPRVSEEITEGRAQISGSFDVIEAKLLSQRLNAGALPVPIELVSQQTVGASLGATSLQKSLFAGMIGFILVMLFMIGYYRLPGVLSVIALLIYIVAIVFLFQLIPITLTLAGIAGFILSIGMAVDANVLIFERMKEEMKMGKPLSSSVDEGFKRAWSSIRDGNVSTLITCFILAWFGTSMIKGFAITLGLGVMLSMFSAIVVTRIFLKYVVSMNKAGKNTWFYGVNKKSGMVKE
ncbi:protein-export membrane protein SecD [Candidatus Falkowbacteria bacterium RIFOXYA2_FULL_35_8]|nr:MAG: protein-export membrane protein SecD [Candidatus Falkowbacteria bacterium RIFOXYA2_FULL_35_8]